MNVGVCDDCVVLAAALVSDAAALPYLCALVAVVLVPAPPLTDRMHIGAYVRMCVLCVLVVFTSVCGSRLLRRCVVDVDRHIDVCALKPGMVWYKDTFIPPLREIPLTSRVREGLRYVFLVLGLLSQVRTDGGSPGGGGSRGGEGRLPGPGLPGAYLQGANQEVHGNFC